MSGEEHNTVVESYRIFVFTDNGIVTISTERGKAAWKIENPFFRKYYLEHIDYGQQNIGEEEISELRLTDKITEAQIEKEKEKVVPHLDTFLQKVMNIENPEERLRRLEKRIWVPDYLPNYKDKFNDVLRITNGEIKDKIEAYLRSIFAEDDIK